MSLVARVKAILMTPKTEWPAIDAEPATVGSIYTGYIIPLAAIPAIATFVGMTVFGFNLLGVSIRWPMAEGLKYAVTQYVLTLASTYVFALIIDALAPNFGGQKNLVKALKVAAYSSTAMWVAGIFGIIPALGILGILGLYSVYLMYLGIPVVMKAPQDKAAGYTAVAIICGIVLYVIVGVITSKLFVSPMGVL